MHIGKENEVTTNYMHIEPLVLPTQLPSDSEDSDGEPGMNEDCIYKEDFISKKTLVPVQEEKVLCIYGNEAQMESNVMEGVKQKVRQFISFCVTYIIRLIIFFQLRKWCLIKALRKEGGQQSYFIVGWVN